MRLSRRQIYTKAFALPQIRFQEQPLTSFGGWLIFQQLFVKLQLKERLQQCSAPLAANPFYHPSVMVLWLIVHLLLGFRKLRDLEFYQDDPLIKRVLQLKVLPNVSTISRTLADFDEPAVQAHEELNQQQVLERLTKEGLRRVTLDFDGRVLWARKHAEGTAVGYNKQKQGARSYYPLFCMVAQTGQVLAVLHRSGNVHDSNGAPEFVRECVRAVREALPGVPIESRLDSAFFSDEMMETLEELGVEFTVSVPFERLAELKGLVEQRRVWWPATVDGKLRFFQKLWKPHCWKAQYRFLFIRQEVALQQKGPIQLDMFVPHQTGFEFKVIVTNKVGLALNIVRFHEGRGQQEKVFAELKDQVQMDYLPGKTWAANKMYLLCALLAHNLGRELQMDASEPERSTNPKRRPLWVFEGLEMMRRKFIQRAGRLTRTNGRLTLTLSANRVLQQIFRKYLEA